MFDPNAVKLGRPLAPVADPRTLRFARYLRSDLPKVPARNDWGAKVKSWGMLDNDKIGNCTIAGLLHGNMLWKSWFGDVPDYSAALARQLYSQHCGFVEGDPSTDNGAVEIDILKAWRKAPIAGVQLDGFAAVDPTNWEEVRLAHYLCGFLYMGVNLPLSAQSEKIWSSTHDKPGTWGGHCMITALTAEPGGICSARHLEAITWGTRQKITPAWLAKYCDELWAPIPAVPTWFGANDNAPNGLHRAQFLADVAACARMAA